MPPIRTSTSSHQPVAPYIPPSKPCGYIPADRYDAVLEVASTKAGRIQMRHAIVENITLQEPGYLLSIEYQSPTPIKRILRVPGTFTFHHLHEALQVAFEWASDGSYSFHLYGVKAYGEDIHGEDLYGEDEEEDDNDEEEDDDDEEEDDDDEEEDDNEEEEEEIIEELVEDSSWLNSHTEYDRFISSKTRKLDQVFGPTMQKFANRPVARVVYTYDCIHNHVITVLGADEDFPHLVPECRTQEVWCVDGHGDPREEDSRRGRVLRKGSFDLLHLNDRLWTFCWTWRRKQRRTW